MQYHPTVGSHTEMPKHTHTRIIPWWAGWPWPEAGRSSPGDRLGAAVAGPGKPGHHLPGAPAEEEDKRCVYWAPG